MGWISTNFTICTWAKHSRQSSFSSLGKDRHLSDVFVWPILQLISGWDGVWPRQAALAGLYWSGRNRGDQFRNRCLQLCESHSACDSQAVKVKGFLFKSFFCCCCFFPFFLPFFLHVALKNSHLYFWKRKAKWHFAKSEASKMWPAEQFYMAPGSSCTAIIKRGKYIWVVCHDCR